MSKSPKPAKGKDKGKDAASPDKAEDLRSRLMLASAAKLKKQILAARASPAAFIEFCMRTPKGERIKLSPFHREWLEHIHTHRRVQIEASKSHGKTTILIGYIVWSIGNNSAIRIKLFAQSEEKARERLSTIADMILNNKLVRLVFPDMQKALRGGVWHKHALQVERNISDKEPTVEASGIMGSVEGGRADMVVLDDISDFRTSLVYPQFREAIKKKVYAEILPMLEEDGRAISIATPHHECLLPAQRVLTDTGRVRADSLQEDSVLWVAPDRYEHAWAITAKDVTTDAYTVLVHGHPEPLLLTGNHRLPTGRGLLRVDELRVGDDLELEVDRSNHDSFPSGAIPEEQPARRDAAKRPSIVSRLTREQLAAELAAGLTYRQIAERHGFSSKSYVLYLVKSYGLPRRRSRQLLDPTAATHPDFWRLVGYWLAEGDLNDSGWNNAVRFTFGPPDDRAEQELVADVVGIVKRLLNVPVHVATASEGSATSVVFRCKALVAWLELNFSRGARHKRLPAWFERLPDECKRQALLGWTLGDGNVHPGYTRVSSASLDLVSDWQRVLATLGFASRINRVKAPSKECCTRSRSGRELTIRTGASYVLHILPEDARLLGLPCADRVCKRAQPRKVRMAGDKLLMPIKKIVKHRYSGKVIDIATRTGYFSLDAVRSHNSDVVASLRKNHEWKSLIYAVGAPGDPFVPLWPERWSREALKRLYNEIGPLEYDRAFRCIAFSSELQIVKPEYIKYYDAEMMPDPWRLLCVQAYDLAITEAKKASYFACVTFLYDQEKNIIFVADAWHTRVGFTEQAQLLVVEARKWQPDRIVVEETGYQKALREYLMEVAKEPLPIFPVKPGNKSKELRLMETLPMFEAGKIYFNPRLDAQIHLEVSGRGDLIGQLIGFATTADKDLGDAFAYGVRALRAFRDEEGDDDWDNGDGVSARMSIIGA